MKPVMTEEKREKLLSIKDAIQSAVDRLNNEIEFSEEISEEEYEHLRAYLQDVHDQIYRFSEEVYYS